jgi:NADP-dependent 3-hydroxy acid dehydrogenase YdfG
MGFAARFGGRRRNLVDRVVLLTGAGHGIGAATARLLVNEGARVALLDCDEAAVRQVAAALNGRAGAFVADVTDPTSLDEAVAAVIAQFGAIDVVVANAGVIGPVDKFEDADPGAYDRMLEVNLLGVIRTVRATLHHVIARRGYLLLVSSAAALSPCPAISGYGAAKAGVEALGRALRIELAPTGASAGVTYFGMMDTGLVRNGLLNNTGWEAIMAALP